MLFGVEELFGVVPGVELPGAAFGEGLDMSLGFELLPETFTLSTTRRLPANDCAMRFASSRSFAEEALPFSWIESSVTSTVMLEEVRVGSLRSAV